MSKIQKTLITNKELDMWLIEEIEKIYLFFNFINFRLDFIFQSIYDL